MGGSPDPAGRAATDPPDPVHVLSALGLPVPEALQPVLGGADTLMWRVQIEGRPYVLRVLGPRADARCDRETASARAAAAGGMPVPGVRVRGRFGDRPVLLLDWCPGEPILDALAARPPDARRLGRLFGIVQARLHALAAPAGHATAWLDAGGPAAEPVRDRLRALGLRTDALIHLDYHPLNVLTDGVHITGVIDWDKGGGGDPRADLARTFTILRLDARRPGFVSPLVAAALMRFEVGWREGYGEAGTAVDDRRLAAFHAWAALAMEQDLAGRRDPAFFRGVRAFAVRWAARAGVRL
jgi:aminoglycoside phosphotransferase (APT) family kinase protein